MSYLDFNKDHLEEIVPPPPGPPRPPEEAVDEALDVLERVQQVLLRQPGARAVDVGFRIQQSDNEFTPDLAIRVHVENKLTPKDIEDGYQPITELNFKKLAGVEFVPLPKKKGQKFGAIKLFHGEKNKSRGFFLDVVEARYLPSSGTTQVSEAKFNQELGERELEALVRSHVHPLVGGISIGSDLGQAGTLGAVVWDRTDGSPCLLSNWHVLAGRLNATVGSPCFQPALLDGGRPSEDLVGRLKRGLFDRHGDAALAAIVSPRPYSTGEILGLWVPVAGTVKPQLGMPVRKWGRTTGFTHGFIDGVGFTVNLDYGGAGVRRFDDQIHIATRFKGKELSAEGDSGAVWVAKYEPRDPKLEEEDPRSKAELPELARAIRHHDSGSVDPNRARPGREETGGEEPKDKEKNSKEYESGKEKETKREGKDAEASDISRVYFAVALNFAGDAPGAKSGEFAVASPIHDLAERLEFSFRPVFFPRSSYVIKSTSGPPPAVETAPATGSPEGPIVQPAGGQGDPSAGPGTEVTGIPPSGRSLRIR